MSSSAAVGRVRGNREMAEEIKLVVSFEIVAEVENLKTLHSEFLLHITYPWGSTFLILEQTEQ
jgi:hypothetical protein